LTGSFQRCILTDSSEVDVPTAEVNIKTPYFTGKVF